MNPVVGNKKLQQSACTARLLFAKHDAEIFSNVINQQTRSFIISLFEEVQRGQVICLTSNSLEEACGRW